MLPAGNYINYSNFSGCACTKHRYTGRARSPVPSGPAQKRSHSNVAHSVAAQVLWPPDSAVDWAADWSCSGGFCAPFFCSLPPNPLWLRVAPVAGTSRFTGARPRSVSLPALDESCSSWTQQLRPETTHKTPPAHQEHCARSVFDEATKRQEVRSCTVYWLSSARARGPRAPRTYLAIQNREATSCIILQHALYCRFLIACLCWAIHGILRSGSQG